MAPPNGLSPPKDAVLTLSILLAMLVAMVVAVVMALYLPIWASVSMTLGAVLSVAIGGPALLAKAAAVAAVLALGAWYWRRHAARQKDQESSRNITLAAIPEPRADGKPPRAKERQPGPLRRAA